MYRILQLTLSIAVLLIAFITLGWIFGLIPQEEVLTLVYRAGGAVLVIAVASAIVGLVFGKRA